MMKSILCKVLLGLGSLLFAVFAQAQTAFDKASNSKLTHIALLQVEEPDTYIAWSAERPNALMGMLSRNTQSGVNQINSTRFTQAMSDKKFSLGLLLTQQIQEELTKQGYELSIIPLSQIGKDKNGKYVDYSQVQTNAQAILQIQILFAGYVAAGTGVDYIPTIGVNARLVSPGDSKQLYYQAFNNGYRFGKATSVENLSDLSSYHFPTVDSLLTQTESAIEGLVNGANPIAPRIAIQLAKEAIEKKPAPDDIAIDADSSGQ
jgi:hypothetical protein